MKRLLILAYDFPPYVSVGGLRPYAWYKYLKEFGVYPVVVTRQWENKYGNELDYIAPSPSQETVDEETEYGTIIRTPYKPNLANRLMLKYGNVKFSLVRKAVTAFYEFAQFLFFVGPKSGLYRGAKDYLKNNSVDVILATGEPFILFKYASALSRKYNVPWIADYRDPWVQNKKRSQFMGQWNAFFERRFLQNAAAMTTVSEFLKKKIRENISVSRTFIIPNGYNPAVVSDVLHIKQKSDRMRIAFAGTIYNWHPYKSVLSLFSDFAKGKNIELNFFGVNRHKELSQMIAENHWEECIHVYPRMNLNELLPILSQHNLMLLFNEYSIMGTKIYDYIGLRRKILFCYSNDQDALFLKKKFYPIDELEGLSNHVQEDLIRDTQSGIIVKDKAQLLIELKKLYNEFTAKGCIACDSQNVEQYSRKHGAKLLAELVTEIVSIC